MEVLPEGGKIRVEYVEGKGYKAQVRSRTCHVKMT
jgi:hypothetical protein